MRAQSTARSNQVRAVFRDATTLAFDLRHGTTLGQLAEQLGELAERHGGLFLPVLVQLAHSQ
jgi:hypothetical protein